MTQLLEITAQYSNAVLVAILPHLSEFAGRLELPIPRPIGTEHIRRFNCDARTDDVGGWVVLKSGYEFWYQHGLVRGFASPRSYKHTQDPVSVPTFFGKIAIDPQQAMNLARTNLLKLGYDLKQVYANIEPQAIVQPEKVGTNVIPYYQIEWRHPLAEINAVEVEVNGATKTVESLSLWNETLWRAPPRLSVPRPEAKSSARPLAPGQTNEFIGKHLPFAARLANQLNLPLPISLKPSHVEKIAYVWNLAGEVGLKLTNGYWFQFEGGELRGFFAPNSLYKRWSGERFRPLREYLGKWNLSETGAVSLARETILKAGYDGKHFDLNRPPDVIKAKQVGPYVVPRYRIRWTVWDTNVSSSVLADAQVEIDADAKAVKYLYVFDGFEQRR